jgi:hypothetical protein
MGEDDRTEMSKEEEDRPELEGATRRRRLAGILSV